MDEKEIEEHCKGIEAKSDKYYGINKGLVLLSYVLLVLLLLKPFQTAPASISNLILYILAFLLGGLFLAIFLLTFSLWLGSKNIPYFCNYWELRPAETDEFFFNLYKAWRNLKLWSDERDTERPKLAEKWLKRASRKISKELTGSSFQIRLLMEDKTIELKRLKRVIDDQLIYNISLFKFREENLRILQELMEYIKDGNTNIDYAGIKSLKKLPSKTYKRLNSFEEFFGRVLESPLGVALCFLVYSLVLSFFITRIFEFDFVLFTGVIFVFLFTLDNKYPIYEPTKDLFRKFFLEYKEKSIKI